MSNGNPFYVHPGTDFGPGLMGLAQTVGQVGERKKAEKIALEKKTKEETMRTEISAAFKSNDPDKIQAIAGKYPELGSKIKDIVEMKFPGGTADVYKNALFTAATDFSKVPQVLENLRTQFIQDGIIDQKEQETLDKFKALSESDPKTAQKDLERELALVSDKETWTKYKDITKKTDSKDTANIKDYEYYETLLQTDPEAAKKFATQVGITKDSDVNYAPDKLTKLLTQLDKFPKDSKRHEYYQKAIDKETSGGNPDLDLILAQRIVDGKLDFNKLSRRGGQKGRIAGLIAQIAPEFSLIDAEANIKYKTDSANLRTIALIAGIDPLFEELKGKAAALNNGMVPIFNKGINAWRLQTGDEKVVAFNNLRDDIIAETERVLMGSGVLSDSKYMRALHNLNTAQSPEQMGAAIQQMVLVVKTRDEALREQPYPQQTSEVPDVKSMSDEELQKIVRGE